MQVAKIEEQRHTGRGFYGGSGLMELPIEVRQNRFEPVSPRRASTEAIRPPFPAQVSQIATDAAVYLGVRCQFCEELVSFDACAHHEFGLGDRGQILGTVRCSQGHHHAYTKRDFVMYPKFVYPEVQPGTCRII